MKNIKGCLQKQQVTHFNNDLPLISNRKLLRAISVEQIFEKVRQNHEKADSRDSRNGLVQRMSIKNLNFDGAAESERADQQLRSRSLTNRIQRSKGSEEKLLLTNSKVNKTKKMSEITTNLDLQIQQQGLQLKKIEWHRQHVNSVLTTLIQSKLNKEFKPSDNEKKFNNILHSQNSLLNAKNLSSGMKKIKQPQQYDFEKQISDGPLLSFRQFAKLQGYKLPKFLQ